MDEDQKDPKKKDDKSGTGETKIVTVKFVDNSSPGKSGKYDWDKIESSIHDHSNEEQWVADSPAGYKTPLEPSKKK